MAGTTPLSQVQDHTYYSTHFVDSLSLVNESNRVTVEMIPKIEKISDDEETERKPNCVEDRDVKPFSSGYRKRPFSSPIHQHSGDVAVPPMVKIHCYRAISEVQITGEGTSSRSGVKKPLMVNLVSDDEETMVGSSNQFFFEDRRGTLPSIENNQVEKNENVEGLSLVACIESDSSPPDLSQPNWENDVSSVNPSASESGIESGTDMTTDITITVVLPDCELGPEESLVQSELIKSSPEEVMSFQDFFIPPSELPSKVLSDDVSDVVHTNTTQISNAVVVPSSDPICETPSEALVSSASVEQHIIPETSVNETENVISNDASSSNSSELVQTISTNNVGSGTSTQMELTYTLPNAMNIPLDTTFESLDQLESELRRSAAKVREIMSPIDVEKKKLDRERAQLEELLKNHRTDYSAKKQVIDTLAKKMEEKVEKKRQCTGKREELGKSLIKAKQNVFQTEMSLRELQIVLLKDQVSALTDSSPDSPFKKEIKSNEEKVKDLEREITEHKKSLQSVQDAVDEVESEIKKMDNECHSLRMRITASEKKCERAALQLTKVEDNLQTVTDRLAEKEAEFNSLSYQFVELEKIMVKIKMTRKLKKLELKQEKFSAPNERLAVVFHESQDRLSTTRQLQFSSQMTTFVSSTSYPLQQASADGRSPAITGQQHFTAFSSIHHNTGHPPPNWMQPNLSFPGIMGWQPQQEQHQS